MGFGEGENSGPVRRTLREITVGCAVRLAIDDFLGPSKQSGAVPRVVFADGVLCAVWRACGGWTEGERSELCWDGERMKGLCFQVWLLGTAGCQIWTGRTWPKEQKFLDAVSCRGGAEFRGAERLAGFLSGVTTPSVCKRRVNTPQANRC